MTRQELIDIAHNWRQQQEDGDKLLHGVVLIFDGEVYGWKNCLRDANHERPDVIAVDADYHVFMAVGGDDQEGAKGWITVNDEPPAPKRENGWYWVRRRPDRHSDETYWSIMYWYNDEWSASGIEWPCYEDGDMVEIKPERLKAPDEL